MTADAAMPSLVAGDVIGGKYVLDRLLGKGGMGVVFAARQTNLNNRPVAIKVMLGNGENEEARQRFLNEGSAAASLRSEHVVQVYDLGSERGFEYMVLELLDGEDLSQQLERGVLSPQLATSYILQALKGLVEAHRNGIIHRDLKPSNLFLARRTDGTSVLKILDFGISKAQSLTSALGQSAGQLTSTKAMLGSPLYMSPEQLRSSRSVDARADVWAMGVILYELMTGRLPFMGESLGELFASILENEVVPPRTYAPQIPPALEQIVLRCLQKRPEHRFASAQELHDVLAHVAAGHSLPNLTAAMPSNVGQPTPSSPHLAAMAMTPSGSRPGMPGMAHTTGSGASMPVVKTTVPLGAVTPGVGQSAPNWAPTPQRNGAAIAAGGFGVLAIVGVIAFVAATRAPKTVTGSGAGASSSVATTATAPAVSATTAASASAPPGPPASSSSSAPPVETTAAVASPPPRPKPSPVGAPAKPPAGGSTGSNPAPVVPVASPPPPPTATTSRPKDGPPTGVLTR